MRFCEALSTERDPRKVLDGLTSKAIEELDGEKPDLGFLFVSPHHRDGIPYLLGEVAARTGVTNLLGCTGQSIIGGGREVEHSPSAALWLAALPGVTLRTFRVECEQTPDGFCFPVTPHGLFYEAGENAAAILLGEPYTMPVDAFVRRFNEDYPGIPIIGGMASGGTGPGENVLLVDGEVYEDGAVGALLSGPIRVRTVVSQGCRPIARRFVVTECDRNTIKQLGGRPALKVIQELFTEISPEDRALFQAAPHVGVVTDEGKSEYGPGDFLIRNILGVDPARGTIFISDYLRRGQTIQFHVRDGAAASEDLAALLELTRSATEGKQPRGGLVFCCNGRGRRLFESADHDISALRNSFGPIPLSGFFAQGEVGPVGRKNHLHGFTTCVALFCEP